MSESKDRGTFKVPLELRVHGRGGQGGVTLAKLIATLYSRLGLQVQTFGDYGSERAGAPIRAYTRVDDKRITNRNKVYNPDHLIVLDPGLMSPAVLDGVAPGALLLINTTEEGAAVAKRYPSLRVGVIDATSIARKHGIGTASVVIINTTLVGAYARLLELPTEVIADAYEKVGLSGDLGAAEEAYGAVEIFEPTKAPEGASKAGGDYVLGRFPEILPLTEHITERFAPVCTGDWRTQTPHYLFHEAPCNGECPAGNDVVGFIQTLKADGADAAARHLSATQPLPSVCGRVCPAPCMGGCSRRLYDGSVNIRGLERWIGDNGDSPPPKKDENKNPKRIAIIGGGPAGLSAAFEAARAGHSVTIYEAAEGFGGVLRYGIPEYRLPNDILDREIRRIEALGVNFIPATAVDSEKIVALSKENDAVVIAVGLGRLADLGFGDLSGVEQGIAFLRAVKSGERMSLAGEEVAVAGGGNTAVDCARTALRLGAEKVTLLYRRGREEMPAIDDEVSDAVEEGVRLELYSQPVGAKGEGAISALEVAEVELFDYDESGRRRPVVTDRKRVIPCTRLFMALGQSPEEGLLPDGWSVDGDRVINGGESLNVWLAGDISTGAGTVAHAIGDGRRVAALALKGGARKEENPKVSSEGVRADFFEERPPMAEKHLPVTERITSFIEVSEGIAGPEEAERCFSCGTCTACDTCLFSCPEGVISREGESYKIDGEFCKGCGICVAECPRMAMDMSALEAGRQ